MSDPKKQNKTKLLQVQNSREDYGQLESNNQQIFNFVVYQGEEKYFCATCLNCCGRSLIWMRFILPCLCVCTNSPFYHQNNNSFGLLENFGRYVKILQPGFNVINPLTQKVIQISRQTKLLTVNQSVISKDNISFDISTIIYYRVFDPIKLAYKLGKTEISESVSELTFATVRTICGEGVFQDLLQKRELIGDRLKDHINQQINTWGIYIEQLFIKDLILSYELQRDLSQVASIKKIQQATIINAQALVETAKCFSQVAQSLSTKAAYQMRYLNILNEVSQQNNQKIIMLPLNEKQ